MVRLDTYLVEKGYCRSRERAKNLILTGTVSVNGKTIQKPSYQITETDTIEVSNTINFFSRGYLKLEKAIEDFGINFTGKLVLDVGASTGGFTYCALQYGARYVWAVDVGTNQLDEQLRNNERICSLEQTDIRTLLPERIGQKVDIVVADLSFISLTQVSQSMVRFMKPEGLMVLLIKPQFEAGRDYVDKNGLVKSSKVHQTVIEQIAAHFAQFGLYMNQLTFAPLKGKGFNIEYLAMFCNQSNPLPNIKSIVENAFQLNKSM